MSIYLQVYICTIWMPGTYRDPKRALGPLELVYSCLWAFVLVLGIDPTSSIRAARALKHWVHLSRSLCLFSFGSDVFLGIIATLCQKYKQTFLSFYNVVIYWIRLYTSSLSISTISFIPLIIAHISLLHSIQHTKNISVDMFAFTEWVQPKEASVIPFKMESKAVLKMVCLGQGRAWKNKPTNKQTHVYAIWNTLEQWFSTCGWPLLAGDQTSLSEGIQRTLENTDICIIIYNSSNITVMRYNTNNFRFVGSPQHEELY